MNRQPDFSKIKMYQFKAAILQYACFKLVNFLKNRVACHQQVLNSKLSLAIALRTFNRFWIALYQILSSSVKIQKI